MAFNDTIASRWFTQAQALNFISTNWDKLEPLLERDDVDSHRSEYVSILNEVTGAGSVENCGGVIALANKYSVSIDLVQAFVTDIKYIVQLYEDYLDSQGV